MCKPTSTLDHFSFGLNALVTASSAGITVLFQRTGERMGKRTWSDSDSLDMYLLLLNIVM